ncbi:MAG: isochorismatase family protein [Burkholderiales bacterium]
MGQNQAKTGTRRGSDTALLLIDFINDLEFPGGDKLLPHALDAAKHTAALKKRARHAGIHAIYANDNFGQWRSDLKQVVAYCSRDNVRGKVMVRAVKPGREGFFVLKPKNSCFFRTPLQVLLDQLGVKKLVLTGLTADICVLFTANDAYLHDYELFVPADCVASMEQTDNAGRRPAVENTKGLTLRFIVENGFIADKNDPHPLAPSDDPMLTLVTCYPFDALTPGGPLRYIVTAVPDARDRVTGASYDKKLGPNLRLPRGTMVIPLSVTDQRLLSASRS